MKLKIEIMHAKNLTFNMHDYNRPVVYGLQVDKYCRVALFAHYNFYNTFLT